MAGRFGLCPCQWLLGLGCALVLIFETLSVLNRYHSLVDFTITLNDKWKELYQVRSNRRVVYRCS